MENKMMTKEELIESKPSKEQIFNSVILNASYNVGEYK